MVKPPLRSSVRFEGDLDSGLSACGLGAEAPLWGWVSECENLADGLFPGVRQLLFILTWSGSLCAPGSGLRTKTEGLAQLWGFGWVVCDCPTTFWQEALVSQEMDFSKITHVCLVCSVMTPLAFN